MPRKQRIRYIPLNQLTRSPRNVRKTPASTEEDAQLKANIAAEDVKQNLIVYPKTKDGVFEVTAGGRRLKALQELAADGAVKDNHPVPCLIEDRESSESTSLAENVIRAAMNPADEFQAFASLVEAGHSIATIANRFGLGERHVRQRLKLGKVAPALLQAYRADEIDLDTLMAFTLSDDHKRQRAVWKQVKKEYFGTSPHTVRRLLTESSVSASSRLGRFVGIQAYEAAGGAVTRDLFSEDDDGYLDDPRLVRKLAMAKLEARAKELEATWKWAEPVLEPNYGFTAGFGRVYPEPIDVPREVAQEIERIDARYDEILSIEGDNLTEALEVEAEKLLERREELEAIRERLRDFTPEDHARAGCLVTIGHNGDFEIHSGLIRPDDLTNDPDHTAQDGPDTNASGEMGQAHLAGEQAIRKQCGLSQALINDLKAHRLQITKAHLVQEFEVAFDVALYSLCIDVLHLGYRDDPLDLRGTETRIESSLNDLRDTPADQVLQAQRAKLEASWLTLPPAEGFDVLCELSLEAKQALFAWCIGQCLKAQLAFEDGADSVIERLGDRLNIPVADYWRPTQENYWGRVKKDHGLGVGGEILGERWRRDRDKDKKVALAKCLGAAFAGDASETAGLDPETRARSAAWMPPGMAYDRSGPEMESHSGGRANSPCGAGDQEPAPGEGEGEEPSKEGLEEVTVATDVPQDCEGTATA